MDAFDFDNVKAEKVDAILRYSRLKSIKKLFRLVELSLGVLLLYWTTSRLPFAVKICGEYFRHVLSLVLSPLFIFLLCNVIILALVFKSGCHLSPVTGDADDLYKEFVVTTTGDSGSRTYPEKSGTEEVVVYEDKETIFEVVHTTSPSVLQSPEVSDPKRVGDMAVQHPDTCCPKMYRRSKSENLERKMMPEGRSCMKLRRSETEKYGRSVQSRCCGGGTAEEMGPGTEYVFNKLSDEEFQRTIEAYIAKQQVKFHQEEKLAIVLHSQA